MAETQDIPTQVIKCEDEGNTTQIIKCEDEDNTEERDRLRRLKRTLHSLATRVPKIVLRQAEELYPSLKEDGIISVHINDNTGTFPLEEKCEIHSNDCSESFTATQLAIHDCDQVSFGETCKTVTTVESINPRFECYICNVIFLSDEILQNHLDRSHTLQERLQSDFNQPETSKIKNICASNCEERKEEEKLIKSTNSAETYPCGLCNMTFSGKYEVLRHKCRIHRFNFNNATDYDSHMKECYSCDVCEDKFIKKEHLKMHKQAHDLFYESKLLTNKNNNCQQFYTCEICEVSFKTRVGLSKYRHIPPSQFDLSTLKHKYQVSYVFVCNICNCNFKATFSLLRHKRAFHGNTTRRPHKCPVCKLSFERKGDLVSHKCNHAKISNSLKIFYKCEICEHPFTGLWDLAKHRQNFHEFPSSKLPLQKLSAEKRQLPHKIKQKSHSSKLPQQLKEPLLKVNKLSGATTHRLLQTTNYLQLRTERLILQTKKLRNRASILTLKSNSSSDQTEEIADRKRIPAKNLPNQRNVIHTMKVSEKPFVCKVCKLLFETKVNLEQHNCHLSQEQQFCESNVVYYICEICKCTYSKKHHLLRHKRMFHFAETQNPSSKVFKSHVCKVCKHGFSKESDFKKHVEKRHPLKESNTRGGTSNVMEELYVCEICESTFSQKDRLSYHKRFFHTNPKLAKFQLMLDNLL